MTEGNPASSSPDVALLLTPIPSARFLTALLALHKVRGRVLETSGGPLAVFEDASPAAVNSATRTVSIDPSYPKLAGQHEDYLYAALKAYQARNNAQVGRGNAVMGGMAAPFNQKELKLLAAYFASLPGEVKTIPESRFR